MHLKLCTHHTLYSRLDSLDTVRSPRCTVQLELGRDGTSIICCRPPPLGELGLARERRHVEKCVSHRRLNCDCGSWACSSAVRTQSMC